MVVGSSPYVLYLLCNQSQGCAGNDMARHGCFKSKIEESVMPTLNEFLCMLESGVGLSREF